MVFEELKSKPSEEKSYKNKADAVYQEEDEFIGAKFSDEFEKKISKTVELLLKKEE